MEQRPSKSELCKPLAPHGLDLGNESRFRRIVRGYFVRHFGFRPILIPRGVRWLIHRSGFNRSDLRRICMGMSTSSDWGKAWELHAHELHSDRRIQRAVLALHWGQYMLGPTDPDKKRLRELAEKWYLKRSDIGDAYIIRSEFKGYTSSLLVQPSQDLSHAPVAVIIPGLFDAKERNHALATRLQAKGVSVARFELDDVTLRSGVEPTALVEILPRAIDDLCERLGVTSDQIHLFGICLGGFYAYHAAARRPVGSLTVISGVADVTAYAKQVPANTFEVLLSREVVEAERDPLRLVSTGAVDAVVNNIQAPTVLHHGLLDAMVPAKDSHRIAQHLGEGATLRLHALDLHGCPRSFRSIASEFVDRMACQARPEVEGPQTEGMGIAA
jgi:dienelactone hydrolase